MNREAPATSALVRWGIALTLLAAGLWASTARVARMISDDGTISSDVLGFYIVAFRLGLLLLAALFAAPAGRVRRVLGKAVYVACLLALLEGFSGILLHARYGQWHFWMEDPRTSLFDRHPYLVGVPRPAAEATRRGVRITHTAEGWRGPAALAPGDARPRIMTLGGSSTYCVGVQDEETWPHQLGLALSNRWAVLNAGVPGYSTVEHVIQASFQVPEWSPDVVLLYAGWNDARNFHVGGLASDYSDFHGKSQYRALQLPRVWTGPDLAVLRLLANIFQKVGWLLRTPEMAGAPPRDDTPQAAARAHELYARNLRSVVALCRARGITVVFVPQIMNAAVLTGDKAYGWLPHVPDRELPSVIEAYNQRMQAVARELGVDCVAEVLAESWRPEDFLDQGHFSPAGNRRFAQLLAAHLHVHQAATRRAMPGGT